MSTPKWAVGMYKLGPGAYSDAAGEMHFDFNELCERFGVPSSKENFDVLRRAVAEAARKIGAEVHDETEPGGDL